MSVKIKKAVFDQSGRVVEEYEGTEEEVEAYERKRNKKNETVQRKRELLKDQVKRLVAEELASRPAPIQILPISYPPSSPYYVPYIVTTTGTIVPSNPLPGWGSPVIDWNSNRSFCTNEITVSSSGSIAGAQLGDCNLVVQGEGASVTDCTVGIYNLQN